MRVVIIGGTGHIGTYLTPRLVQEGHSAVCVCRRQSQPYQSNGLWEQVQFAVMDRQAEEAAGTFGKRVAELEPDAVIDLTCYTVESASQLLQALRGRIRHFLHCGTIWVHGPSVQVPTTEEQPRRPFGAYGLRKAAIEAYLLAEARAGQFPRLHPASGTHRWAGLGAVEPGRQLQSGRVLRRRARRGAGPSQSGSGDSPPRPCRRRGTGVLPRAGELECFGRRELSRGIAGCLDLAWLRRVDVRVVRAGAEAPVSALGGVAQDGFVQGGGRHLGPHCPLAELQHSQS